jgi:hypothetical protein
MHKDQAISHGPADADQTEESRLAQLRDAATRFRLAIERCDLKRLTVCMRDFPVGSCGDAMPLLGTYFIEQGLGTFSYVLGERATNDSIDGHRSHAWLEADGIIVDITADQFSEVDQKIIVTRHSAWHAAFERDEALPHAADYRIYDLHTVSSLGQAYGIILGEMERQLRRPCT